MNKAVKDGKVRRPFTLRDVDNEVLARGVVYEQGNVQVLWRTDLGWGGEQYNTTANILDLIPGIQSFYWEDL